MTISIRRNAAGNCITFLGSSQPVYWNACLSAEEDPTVPNTVNIINNIRSIPGDTYYEKYQIPYTEFTDADDNPFPDVTTCVTYINEQASVGLGDIGPGDPVLGEYIYPANAFNPRGRVGEADTSIGDLPSTLLFDSGTTEVAAVVVYLDHRYTPGSDLMPHLHWCKSTSATGDVVWEIDYQICKKGAAAASVVTLSSTGLDANTPDNNTAFEHLESSFGTIPGTGLDQSDILILTIRRKATDAGDTYGADAHLLSTDVDFTLYSTV